ncbi:hypothetical protein GCM10023205_80330 [Yinghuangia aomiensis]|uniref:Uncharacterized protein n=1 Tax=Yinghuangia aomiensis TaxID=676205 RepID=A0ABP9IFM3_9ACTN
MASSKYGTEYGMGIGRAPDPVVVPVKLCDGYRIAAPEPPHGRPGTA